MAAPSRLVQTRPTGHGRARGLVSSRESGARVEACTYAVAQDLRDVAATLWAGRWDLRGQAPHVTELLGDPCVHLVFETGDDPGVGQLGSRIVGVWTRLWRRTLQGRGRVRGVKLRAGAARAFLPLPACQLSNRITALHRVFGSDAQALERDVLGPEDDGEGFAHLQDWLRRHRTPPGTQPLALAIALVERIASDPEITTVDRLAAVGGLGPRALQRLFREYVGATPKWVIRRNRLQEVALRIERGHVPSLAVLAAELGYTDQAHLARDFKGAVGKTPSDFAASVRPRS